MEYTVTVGRRKTAVARVFVKPSTSDEGQFVINGRTFDQYLNNEVLKMKVNKPFELLGIAKTAYDIKVNVVGGGVNGQAEAIRLGISRALQTINPELRSPLKKEGLLSVDSRQVERKKYGRRKARRRFQFSKR
jgi:small subunit ribosomal protein S9